MSGWIIGHLCMNFITRPGVGAQDAESSNTLVTYLDFLVGSTILKLSRAHTPCPLPLLKNQVFSVQKSEFKAS